MSLLKATGTLATLIKPLKPLLLKIITNNSKYQSAAREST